jgi:hypothetical protein
MTIEDISSPFHENSEDAWRPSIREDAILSRREALSCCIEGIRQLMKPEEFSEIVSKILKPPQEEK